MMQQVFILGTRKTWDFRAVFQRFNPVRFGVVKIYMHVMIECS